MHVRKKLNYCKTNVKCTMYELIQIELLSGGLHKKEIQHHLQLLIFVCSVEKACATSNHHCLFPLGKLQSLDVRRDARLEDSLHHLGYSVCAAYSSLSFLFIEKKGHRHQTPYHHCMFTLFSKYWLHISIKHDSRFCFVRQFVFSRFSYLGDAI